VTAHLDLDALADLLAGEGGAREADHVAGCAACSSALEDLDRAQDPVRRALAGLPAPVVPADLAARLHAALLQAREPTGSARLLPLPTGRRRRLPAPERLLAGAAGVVVLLVLGVLALGVHRTGGGGGDSSASSSGASAGSAQAPRLEGGAPALDPTVLAGLPTSSTGVDYSGGPAAVSAALAGLLAAPPPGSPASSRPADPLDRLRDPGELAGCLSSLLAPGPPGGPLALDYARYAGAPALVAVLPTADPGRVEVVVVGAGCRAGTPGTLLRTAVARPS
jgi:hypothetical protein